ncbi:saccharopine dehydrogenase NADP-binding domain-containing protein [Curvibacter sp. APW13]|uniref:saccharopine dehydrogenase family protein n=1 Tax=Curvibacter sp. APW13 TaxID=3077236 RepID=UPI0028DDCD78|nr:saccharopine dehydrogenase NADP-binding domain-containing protein [Curvibacter sp. APW13]MDT8989925.1 saccharopine dehydrogenase NADP-binding domain-containing protein [Curvibacter sp. APW13]
MPRASEAYDLVLYGATGFVGRQTVAYIAAHPDVRASGLRWALAGRNRAKLEALQRELQVPQAGVLVADAADTSALDTLARSARVVLSTAGPFALYGTPLVEACVRQGCHYVDITGETPWVKGLIDRLHQEAQRRHARIIPCCGFDSIPSDIGAFLAQNTMRSVHGRDCVDVKAAYSIRGGFNGGTLASFFHMLDAGQAQAMRDPFLLNPADHRPAHPEAHADPVGPRFDADLDSWLGPFFMAPVNTRVVRRSAALLDYGADFHYQEYLRLGRGGSRAVAATALSASSVATQWAMGLKPVRALARRLAPAPGEGPSQASMDKGSFQSRIVGRAADGTLVHGRIADQGDPGNRATTKMLCESALALALQDKELPQGRKHGGVLTPASGLGDVLVARLRAAGMTLQMG